MTPRAALALAMAILAVGGGGAGCGAGEEPSTAPPIALARPRATLALEPDVLRIGDTADVEILVATPPEHVLAPFTPPKVEGLWLLAAEMPPVEKSATQWLHRIRIRVRPRSLGFHRWPETHVSVEAPEGAVTELDVEGREIEIVSTLAGQPGQVTPYGMIAATEASRDSPIDSLGAAGLGAGAALALVGIVAAVRRVSAQRRARNASLSRTAPGPAEPDLFDWALGQLADAEASMAEHPREAANRGASVLRAYVANRFGADTRARTTQELSDAEPPMAVYSRWPYFLRVLRDLDEVRFRPVDLESQDGDGRRHVAAALEAVRRFVGDSRPPSRGTRT